MDPFDIDIEEREDSLYGLPQMLSKDIEPYNPSNIISFSNGLKGYLNCKPTLTDFCNDINAIYVLNRNRWIV